MPTFDQQTLTDRIIHLLTRAMRRWQTVLDHAEDLTGLHIEVRRGERGGFQVVSIRPEWRWDVRHDPSLDPKPGR